MAKQKKLKLYKIKGYSPIIALMGGKHHTDYMPNDYGTIMNSKVEKITSKAAVPIRTKNKRGIFTKYTK